MCQGLKYTMLYILIKMKDAEKRHKEKFKNEVCLNVLLIFLVHH